jgi:hypothetical protein
MRAGAGRSRGTAKSCGRVGRTTGRYYGISHNAGSGDRCKKNAGPGEHRYKGTPRQGLATDAGS